jgi:hypothetical protein
LLFSGIVFEAIVGVEGLAGAEAGCDEGKEKSPLKIPIARQPKKTRIQRKMMNTVFMESQGS